MNKHIRIAVAAATIVGGFGIAQTGTASAAHCAKDGSPGFSYFGQEGRTSDGNVGNAGATECTDTANPSTRAPGQND